MIVNLDLPGDTDCYSRLFERRLSLCRCDGTRRTFFDFDCNSSIRNSIRRTYQSNFDLMKWFVNHGQDKTRPSLDKVIASLKEQGVTAFGATGYCFGGLYLALTHESPCI